MKTKPLVYAAIIGVAILVVVLTSYSRVEADIRTKDAVLINLRLDYLDFRFEPGYIEELRYKQALYLAPINLGIMDIYQDESRLRSVIQQNIPGIVLYIRIQYPGSFLNAIRELHDARERVETAVEKKKKNP